MFCVCACNLYVVELCASPLFYLQLILRPLLMASHNSIMSFRKLLCIEAGEGCHAKSVNCISSMYAFSKPDDRH